MFDSMCRVSLSRDKKEWQRQLLFVIFEMHIVHELPLLHLPILALVTCYVVHELITRPLLQYITISVRYSNYHPLARLARENAVSCSGS